jgi:hypothetical protein
MDFYIGRKGLGNVDTNFKKVIICFEIGNCDLNKSFIRHTAVFFPDNRHLFYIRDIAFKHLFKQYHYNVNDANYINNPRLPSLYTCITYYNKFVDPDLSITEDSSVEFIFSALLNNADVIALIIC